MIVLLDANVLLRDPMCEGHVWRVLAHAPESWNLRVFVTEVVVAETVARYQAEVATVLTGWGKITKGSARLGLEDAASNVVQAVRAAIEGYEAHLRDSLSAAHVELIPPPDVPHMELVARSVTRRRPCDDKGDGYRDTLNWPPF